MVRRSTRSALHRVSALKSRYGKVSIWALSWVLSEIPLNLFFFFIKPVTHFLKIHKQLWVSVDPKIKFTTEWRNNISNFAPIISSKSFLSHHIVHSAPVSCFVSPFPCSTVPLAWLCLWRTKTYSSVNNNTALRRWCGTENNSSKSTWVSVFYQWGGDSDTWSLPVFSAMSFNARVTWKQQFKVDEVNLTNWVTCNCTGLTSNQASLNIQIMVFSH